MTNVSVRKRGTMDGVAEFHSPEATELRRSLQEKVELSKSYDRAKSTSPLLCSLSESCNRPNGRIIIVHVEGNIGAGKETFMRHLETIYNLIDHFSHGSRKYKAVFCYEPVDEFAWVLQKARNEPNISWYWVQQEILLTRMNHMIKYYHQAKNMLEDHDGDVILFIERSLYGDWVFSKVTYESGQMLEHEYESYKKFWQFCYDTSNLRLDYGVYITPPVEKCPERIFVRTRDFEQQLPMEYLKALQDGHDAQFKQDSLKKGVAAFKDYHNRTIPVFLHENPDADEPSQLKLAGDILAKLMQHEHDSH
jgi:deoxyadenosine/deoxycytidine kinase